MSEGEVLFRVDPARLETTVALASSDLDETVAGLAEAKAAVELAKLEVKAATTQFKVRQQALSRQEELRDRGVGTAELVEAAALALSSAEQALIGRRQVQAQIEARVAQSEIAVDRRKIALDEARRTLAEATVVAPFAGVMSGVSAVRGGLVSMNEKLGELIDPTAMEVAFRVTNTQFARLLNNEGKLRKAEVTLLLQHGRTRTEAKAKVERAGAEVGEGQVGRLVYARLVDPDLTLLRPGDFVTVEIPERPLSDVARIPGTAASADGRILVIGTGDRLEEVQVKMLRQQGDDLIVGDVPFGRQYVLARAQQLGPGIQVQPVSPQPEGAAAPAEPDAPETIVLDEERRARLIAFVEASENMQAASKEKGSGRACQSPRSCWKSSNALKRRWSNRPWHVHLGMRRAAAFCPISPGTGRRRAF